MKLRMTVTVASLVIAATACSSSGSSGSNDSNDSKSAPTTKVAATTGRTGPTTAVPANLTVLVTNDDGYDADGIDAMVEALRKMPGTSVTVVAPAKNQSGTDGKTTPGPLTGTKEATASGYPATAVDGYPADAIRYALSTELGAPPDLVVSGINNGQNVGPFVAVSGTVGAAKAAAAEGIPAIAVSQGAGASPDYPSAARIVISYITAHRGDFGGSHDGDAEVLNFNVPTCTKGSVRAVKQVPAAADLAGRDFNKVDCTSTAESPRDDVDAFIEGFATLTELDASGTTVTATTVWTG